MKSKIKPVLAFMMVCGVLAACKIAPEKEVAKSTDPVDSTTVLTTPDSVALLPDSASIR